MKNKKLEDYINSLMKKKTVKVDDLFSKSGEFKVREFCTGGYNPYSHWGDADEYDMVMFYHMHLFNEDGYTQLNNDELINFIRENNISPFADIVEYLYSKSIDRGCKGNYTAIYAWR